MSRQAEDKARQQHQIARTGLLAVSGAAAAWAWVSALRDWSRMAVSAPIAVHWGFTGKADYFLRDRRAVWILPILASALPAVLAAKKYDLVRFNAPLTATEYQQKHRDAALTFVHGLAAQTSLGLAILTSKAVNYATDTGTADAPVIVGMMVGGLVSSTATYLGLAQAIG